MQEYSRHVEHHDLARWRDDLETFFGRPQDLVALRQTRFHGVARSERFGAIALTHLFTETPIRIRRGVLRAAPSARYHIFFIQHGEMQDAGGQRLSAGNMMIVNNDHAYHASQSDHFRSLVITIPAGMMRSRLPDIDLRCGMPVRSTRGPQRLLHDYAMSLLAQAPDLPLPLRAQAEAHLLDLLCAVAPGAGPDRLERQCPRRYLLAHLADPAISPATAALALGVSVRTIHARMALLGTTFARELREQRLQRCHADLLQGKASGTITEVARRWGFDDPGSFSRLFRARFGVTPRDRRKQRRE